MLSSAREKKERLSVRQSVFRKPRLKGLGNLASLTALTVSPTSNYQIGKNNTDQQQTVRLLRRSDRGFSTYAASLLLGPERNELGTSFQVGYACARRDRVCSRQGIAQCRVLIRSSPAQSRVSRFSDKQRFRRRLSLERCLMRELILPRSDKLSMAVGRRKVCGIFIDRGVPPVIRLSPRYRFAHSLGLYCSNSGPALDSSARGCRIIVHVHIQAA